MFSTFRVVSKKIKTDLQQQQTNINRLSKYQLSQCASRIDITSIVVSRRELVPLQATLPMASSKTFNDKRTSLYKVEWLMGIDSGIPAIVVKKKNEVRKYDIYIFQQYNNGAALTVIIN